MKRTRGFSLIEVNIAILVVAGGLLSLFSLFPAGLRMSNAAMSDTRQALFADDFFAYFDDGVRLIDNRDDWQNIEEFWKAAREGLKDGFGSNASLNDTNWSGDPKVREDWNVNASDLQNGNPSSGNKQNLFYLRFRNGIIKKYFTDTLDAEFLVRIASDVVVDGFPQDGLLWRVSLVVSDEGPNGWYYDNPVYHRDFRYAELP